MLSYYLQRHQTYHPLSVKKPLHNITNGQRLQPDVSATIRLLSSLRTFKKSLICISNGGPLLHLHPVLAYLFGPTLCLYAIIQPPRHSRHALATLRPKIRQKSVPRHGITGFLPRLRFEMIWRWCMVAQHKRPSIYIGSGRENQMLVRAGWRVCCTSTEKPWVAARHRRVLSRCPRVRQRCFGFLG